MLFQLPSFRRGSTTDGPGYPPSGPGYPPAGPVYPPAQPTQWNVPAPGPYQPGAAPMVRTASHRPPPPPKGSREPPASRLLHPGVHPELTRPRV